jgi:phosphate transport system permease protein
VPDRASTLTGRPALGDVAFRYATLGAGLLVLVILVLIAYSTGSEARPWLEHDGLGALTSTDWSPAFEHFGAAAFIFGTAVTSAIALVLAVPVSLGIALYITQVAPQRLARPIIYVVDLLAVIPSVVFGLWGILVVAPQVVGTYDAIGSALDGVPGIGSLFAGPRSGASFVTAGVILAIMITPIVTSLAREVIDTTPVSEKEAAYGLGATRWEMITGAIWPHGKAGIVGAVMLGMGRAMGETIAAALVIGSSAQVTARLFGPGDSMPAVIANQFGEAAGTQRAALIGLGVVLFLITIIVNLAARVVVQRSLRRSRGA